MEADLARTRSQTGAERMRIATEAARESAQREAETATARLEEGIEATAKLQRTAIDAAVMSAANMGHRQAPHTYSERISASRNSRDEVAFIEVVADLVSAKVVEDLKGEGFQVDTVTREVVDYRDSVDSPPEYYDTSFTVSW